VRRACAGPEGPAYTRVGAPADVYNQSLGFLSADTFERLLD